jgi:hypothetical protein
MTCPQDVGACTAVCGNGIAEPGETCSNCPKDIRYCSGSCGNGVVEVNL